MNRIKIVSLAKGMVKAIMPAVLFFSFFLTANFSVSAAANVVQSPGADNPDLIQGQELFSKVRKMFYNAEAPFNSDKEVLNSSSESFKKLPDGYEKYYWLAQVEFTRAEIAENSGDKKQAAVSFTESGNLARKALGANAKHSDSNRLLADTIMRLMDYNGAMYTMSQGPGVLKLLKNALSLDNHNFPALNSLGMYYISAPAIGGGDVGKGIATIQKALASKDEFDHFISNVWLGKAYQKKKSFAEASSYYKKALEIYPSSPWVKALLKGIEGQQ